MKPFFGLWLIMEKTVVKPRYENTGRKPFLAQWTFPHLVDQQGLNIHKNDKIYRVRLIVDILLPCFRYHYSLHKAIIPTKNRLNIKHCIKDKASSEASPGQCSVGCEAVQLESSMTGVSLPCCLRQAHSFGCGFDR